MEFVNGFCLSLIREYFIKAFDNVEHAFIKKP
jgi:hypothetical protein